MPLAGFNIIVGMDCLANNRAQINYDSKTINLLTPGNDKLIILENSIAAGGHTVPLES